MLRFTHTKRRLFVERAQATPANGATNAEIAAALNLTTSTVKSYMKIIMNKLDASTRYEAVMVARREGVIL